MTREESVKILKAAVSWVEWDYPMDIAAALDIAIEALEREQQGEWDMFQRITSAEYGKQCYSLQENGMVYSRRSHQMMTKDDAIKEFLNEIYRNI